MHKKITIENFKCFSEKTEIRLGKISVCVGSNSVGKSSVIQSCILLRQIYEQARLFQDTKVKEFRIQLNDIYGLQLGDSEHIKSAKDKEDIILKIDDYALENIYKNIDEGIPQSYFGIPSFLITLQFFQQCLLKLPLLPRPSHFAELS